MLKIIMRQNVLRIKTALIKGVRRALLAPSVPREFDIQCDKKAFRT